MNEEKKDKKIIIGEEDLSKLKDMWVRIDKAKNYQLSCTKDVTIKQLEGDKWAYYLEKIKLELFNCKKIQKQASVTLEEEKKACEDFYKSLGKKYGFEAGKGAIDPNTGRWTPEKAYLDKRE